MALSVITNPTSGTISGVQTAPSSVPTISGVTSAPSTAPLTVQPLSGSNYNPQATVTAPVVQPAATVKTVMPNTTTAQNVNTTPTADSQTFKLGDGSVYNSSGQQISGPTGATAVGYSTTTGGASQASGGTSLNTPTPNITQPSTSLTGDTGYSDIQKMLSTNLDNLDKMFANLSKYATVPQTEMDQQAKVASDQAGMQALGYQAQGLYNPNNQAIDMPFLTGQAQNKLVGAGLQSTLDQSVLNYMQGNRQFAFNSASTIFDAAKTNLNTTLDAYAKMAPQNLSTNYNPSTGAVNAIMRNPLTGATYTADLGNIGAQHSFTSTNITTDPMTGSLTFVGTTSDGQVIQQPIGGGSSFNSGSNVNPLSGPTSSGNYTSTSAPQQATMGALLSNWTSGGKTMPGAGYQGAVYQTFSQLTGQKIDANTPTSTLVSNIPALTQGIIKAENISASLVAATNNPTAILYANQVGAVPYHANNGYTYAKFATMQDGINAANDLVARKLGATPTPPSASPTLQQTVQNMPPALQGAVRYLPDGTPYFNANQLTAGQIPMAQAQATRTGIPYVNATDSDKLQNISVTSDALSSLRNLVNRQGTLGYGQQSGFLGGISNVIGGHVNAMLGGTTIADYNSFRSTAINAIQSLAGGAGSGLRLNSGEIQTAVDSLPTYQDYRTTANAKLDALNAKLTSWVTQIIPAWQPASQSKPDYTSVLNNLIQGSNPQQ